MVDVIGIDVYDSGMPGNPRDPAVRWTRLDHEPGGLAQIVAFARRHGKPLSVPEWGVVNASGKGLGDDPAYVAGIAAVVKNNDVVYQAYFDRPVGGVMALKDAPQIPAPLDEVLRPAGLPPRSAVVTDPSEGRSTPATRSVIASQLYSASQPSSRSAGPRPDPAGSSVSHALTAAAIAAAEGSGRPFPAMRASPGAGPGWPGPRS